MKKFYLLAAVATAAFATPALAQEVSSAPNGFRIEAIGGYDKLSYEFDNADAALVNDALEQLGVGLAVSATDISAKGAFFGASVGYDFPISSLVSLGVDAEASFAGADRKEKASFVFTDENDVDWDVSLQAGFKARRDLYAGLRLTYAVSPVVNLYVKGGYTNARGKISLKGTASDGVDTFADSIAVSKNADGVRFGAGAQFNVTKKLYIGAEYRYSDYEYDLSRSQFAATVGARF